MERKDNPAFEYASAVMPAEQYKDEEDVISDGVSDSSSNLEEAARMMRIAMRALVNAAGGDPVNLWYAVQRAAGMSLAEIGAGSNISKQAVCKRLARICRDSPAAAAYLGMASSPLDETIAGDGEAISIMMEHEKRRRKLSLWLTKNKG